MVFFSVAVRAYKDFTAVWETQGWIYNYSVSNIYKQPGLLKKNQKKPAAKIVSRL